MNEETIRSLLPPAHQKIAVLLLALLTAIWIVQMVRAHRMREELAILWFGGLAIGVFFVWCDPVLILVTSLLGVALPASALLLLSVFFLAFVAIWLTSEVSRQKQRVAELVIAVSILQEKLKEQG